MPADPIKDAADQVASSIAASLNQAARFLSVAVPASWGKLNESYAGRVLRLTLLAPDIVETILGGQQPAEVTLAGLIRPFPVGWREQSRILGA